MQAPLKKVIIGSLIILIFALPIGLIKANTLTSILHNSINSQNNTEAPINQSTSTQQPDNTNTSQVIDQVIDMTDQQQNNTINANAHQVAVTAKVEATWNTISLTFCRPVKICLYEFVDPNQPKNEVPGYSFRPNETEGFPYVSPNRTKWSRKAGLTPGATYRLHYSVLLYDGDYAEYEKIVTVPLNGTGVSSVTALNATQIRIGFDGPIDQTNWQHEHYTISDESGPLPIVYSGLEGSPYGFTAVVLSLGRAMKNGSTVQVSVSGVCRTKTGTSNTSVPDYIPPFDCGLDLSNVLQPYHTTLTINGIDLVPPEVTNISFTKDSNGRVTNLCITFSEGLRGDAGVAGGSVKLTNPNGQVMTGALYTSKPFSNGASQIVFPFAPNINISTGQYTVSISEFTAQDPARNYNTPCTRIVNF